MKVKIKQINVDDILLDSENPRYHELRLVTGKKKLTDKQLFSIIESEDISDIYNSIKELGVIDPIWVVPRNDKYVVIEGNRRVVTLKKLLQEKTTPPSNISYKLISAQVLDADITEQELDKKRITLQGGKKDWSPFNIASVIKKLFMMHHYTIKQISKMIYRPIPYIERELDNYDHYLEYSKYRKKRGLSEFDYKYTYFQKAGLAVREKFFQTFNQREIFFSLITEKQNGKPARINTVALRGGLYRFNQVCQNQVILDLFLRSTTMTVEEAIDLIKENNIFSAYPWLKSIQKINKGFDRLNKKDITKLKNDEDFIEQVKSMRQFCEHFLDQ